MKKLLLLISIIFISNKGFSQNYIPFPDSAAVWVNAQYWFTQGPPPSPPGIGTWSFMFANNYCVNGEDTLIGSNNYTKLNYCSGAYKGAMRDDNGKWLFVPKDSLNELLIFDFTLNPGDTVSVYCDFYYGHGFWGRVNSVDSILVNGKYRKRLFFDTSYWIEGIGNTKGLLRESWANVSNYTAQLHCMSVNDTTIYNGNLVGGSYFNYGPLSPGIPGACALNLSSNEIPNNTSIINAYPNPSNGVFTITMNQQNTQYSISVFDYLGKQIDEEKLLNNNTIEIDLSNQPNGIYLIRLKNNYGNIVTRRISKAD